MNPADSQRSSASPEDARKRATAYHEAGHAVMALSLGRPLERVTIVPSKIPYGADTLGACHIQKGRFKPSKDQLEDDMLILLAGMVAESKVTGDYCREGADTDLRLVRKLAESRASSERQVERVERRAIDKTEALLDDEANSLALELIAKELLVRETISGRSARHLFDQAQRKFE